MTKKQLTAYIMEAVDAMEEEDLTLLFPDGDQPDLYTIVNELTALKGVVQKFAQTSLKLHNNVEQAQHDNEQRWAKLFEELTVLNPNAHGSEEQLSETRTQLLLSLTNQDETFDRTMAAFKKMPEIHLITWLKFKAAYQTWSVGYLMAQQQWSQLLEVIGLEKIGLPREIFDAKKHQAIGVKYDETQPENAILETEVAGYLYQNKVLKTAKVIVNRKK